MAIKAASSADAGLSYCSSASITHIKAGCTSIREALLGRRHLQMALKPIRKAIVVYNRNSYLLQGLICLALNTAVLAGRVFQDFPKPIFHGALFSLSVVGIITVPEQTLNVLKSAGDFYRALRSLEPLAVVMVALKVFREASGILLTLGHLFAVISSIAGCKQVSGQIYAAMGAWGLACMIISPLVELYRQYSCCKMACKIQQIDKARDRDMCIRELLYHLKGRPYPEKKASVLLPSRAAVIRLLRREGWQRLSKELKKLPEGQGDGFTIGEYELAERIFENLKRQIQVEKVLSIADQLLVELGSMAMLVGNLYMGRWQQALTTWVMSLLYNCRMLYARISDIVMACLLQRVKPLIA